MPRQIIPFAAADMSALAKSLRAQLAARATPPSHVEMLNMLARGAGHRNFQQLRAGAAPAAAGSPRPPADSTALLRAARCFDAQGRLQRWPSRTAIQHLCLWPLWARIPRGKSFSERGISTLLAGLNLFGDHAILRRTMCERGLMTRTRDGRDYRRVEQVPPPEGAALIRHLRSV
ncbi:MAG TPA: DUF2087 domain-containing protein [Allosphingosinicella sp.]|nr:DUF2087 domain-containing protein [Allosphingosinicella sp.]